VSWSNPDADVDFDDDNTPPAQSTSDEQGILEFNPIVVLPYILMCSCLAVLAVHLVCVTIHNSLHHSLQVHSYCRTSCVRVSIQASSLNCVNDTGNCGTTRVVIIHSNVRSFERNNFDDMESENGSACMAAASCIQMIFAPNIQI
jgi:hypothetical protein